MLNINITDVSCSRLFYFYFDTRAFQADFILKTVLFFWNMTQLKDKEGLQEQYNNSTDSSRLEGLVSIYFEQHT